MVREGRVTDDPLQRDLARFLQRLHARLDGYTPSGLPPELVRAAAARGGGGGGGGGGAAAAPAASKARGGGISSFFGGLLSRDAGASAASSSSSAAYEALSKPARRGSAPQGVYIHGPPGCGKTFLMDMFFAEAPVAAKKRVHFNKFMLDVHARVHEARASGRVEGDAVPWLAGEIAREATLLCFDEFQVLDIADAMVIRRLFDMLFRAGVVVVATSNRPPAELYKNGLQRELFVPFIEQLPEFCGVVDMDSSVDYRAAGTALSDVYFVGATARADMDAAFALVLGEGATVAPATVQVMQGRELAVPAAARGVCRFTFHQLCDRALGAADYLAVVGNYHTVFVDDIPVLRSEERNLVRRFILLVDELYQARARLVCSAGDVPARLLVSSPDSPFDEVFAFDRCVSRLVEMQSEQYRERFRQERGGVR